jgi:glycolate oxidase FAD binding subunit
MTLEPSTLDELLQVVPAHDTIRVRAGGTKSGSAPSGVTLDLRRLRGIADYSSDECVVTALPGTPIAEIEQALHASGQYLPFDPPLSASGATLGGTLATGLSGSGRYRYGGVRDFVIGARVVDGEGRLIRSGGKVVKNAAGFLLHHAMVGSLGRLGVLAEVTLKVFPRPETRATLQIATGSLDGAMRLAQLPDIRRADLEAVDFDGSGVVWLRVAGRAAALPGRLARLRSAVGGTIVEGADEERLWADAREFAWAEGATVVKVPRPLARPFATSRATRYTCAGTCLWLAVDDVTDTSARLAAAGLQGIVIRGPQAGTHLGAQVPNTFGDHVRRVLDPRGRFSAA